MADAAAKANISVGDQYYYRPRSYYSNTTTSTDGATIAIIVIVLFLVSGLLVCLDRVYQCHACDDYNWYGGYGYPYGYNRNYYPPPAQPNVVYVQNVTPPREPGRAVLRDDRQTRYM